jgi:hypothetical protein
MPIGTDRPTANDVFQAAAPLAAKGWKLVDLHGVREDGTCACDKGAACNNPGKHPASGYGWQLKATNDEETIASWFEGEPDVVANVGVLLGPASGVIDVECDSEQATKSLRTWGLEACDTPTFRSGRGLHKLFSWETGMPDSTVVKVDGIEVRLGGEGKALQSVIPPSWHAAGFAREWLPGKSPGDCELQPLPEAFKKAVMAADRSSGGSGRAKQARAATAEGKVFHSGEGRHDYLHGEAVAIARQTKNLGSQSEVDRIGNLVLALNDRFCDPPYSEDEVLRTVDDAIEWVKTTRNAGVPDLDPRHPDAARILAAQQTPWERMGLVKDPVNTSEYEPGRWLLTVRHSDPKEYVIDGVISPTSGAVAVVLTAEDYLSAAKTARKILSTAGDVDPTNPNSAEWSRLWNGYSNEQEGGGRRTVKGLKCKLMEACRHDFPPAEYQRYSLLASWMLDYLRRFKKPTSEDVTEPSPTGTPKWIFAGGQPALAFRYEDAWRRAVEQAGGAVTTAEWRDMSRRIRNITGEKEFSDMSRRRKGDSPGCRFTLWDDRHIAALEKLAGV